jgi:MscS family membrane protein
MLEDFLTKTYYGNTVQQWLISLSLILAIGLAGKLLYWVLSNTIKALTKKTKTKLDDIIIDMVEEPLIFGLILGGTWYSLTLLTLSDGVRLFIVHAFQFLIALNVTWLISRLFEALYQEYMIPYAEKTESDIDDQLFPILRQGIKGIVWILGIIVGLNNAGYDVGAILAGLGLGGLALAMAAKDTVSNVFGGLTIFMDKLFKVKERIKVGNVDGIVEEVGLRSTKIRTLDGRIVTVPNSEFTNKPVENISSEPSRKVAITLGLSMNTSPEKIKKTMEIIDKILEKNKDLTKKRFVNFSGFGEYSYNIFVMYFIKKEANIGKTNTDLNLEIISQLNKNKIELAYPTHTILTKKP